MENKNLAKNVEKSWDFDFSQISLIFLLRKMCLRTLLTHNDTDSPSSCKNVESKKLPDIRWVRVCFIKWA